MQQLVPFPCIIAVVVCIGKSEDNKASNAAYSDNIMYAERISEIHLLNGPSRSRLI